MTRSNRSLTQFAVNQVKHYLTTPAPDAPRTREAGNTQVVDNPWCEARLISVNLFNAKIFQVVGSVFRGDRVRWITLGAGSIFDGQGRPTRTTRERLNGLLDMLGELGVVPQDTRVFIEKETCWVGNRVSRTPFNSEHPVVTIAAHSKQLTFGCRE